MAKRPEPSLAERIKRLRKALRISQIELAFRVQTDQGTVSRWETGRVRPAPEHLVKLARLVENEDKFYFLDLAGVPDAFFMGERMLPEMLDASTRVVAQALPPVNGTSETFPIESQLRIIRLVKDSSKIGTPEAVQPENVERSFYFPPDWMPQTGTIHAARVKTSALSPLIEGDLIALIDVDRRDPDRLLGSIVAVRSPRGIQPMKLRKDGSTYLLAPLQETADSTVRVLRTAGDWSIIGRIVKWLGDAPSPHIQPVRR